jgi:triosephosphate isomerase
MRQKLVVGNWKLHGSKAQLEDLLADVIAGSENLTSAVEIGVCPTYVYLGHAAQILVSSRVKLGAQNVARAGEGAYTGEVAAEMLAECELVYVIVGHSERRQLFHESDTEVAEKFAQVQASDLTPILCVGETLEEREQELTDQVVLGQLDEIINKVGIDAVANSVIAYEPIWAIGTGKTANPEQAQDVHKTIRNHLRKQNEDVAETVRIIYGGSVKATNARELFQQADIDGGLVGGASLQAEEFISICNSAD